MTDISFPLLVLYFTLYSIAGWLCETLWCSVGNRKPINRGFLTGPWCPIYGFGALLILGITKPLPQHPAVIFLISMVTASALEYITGWLLEALFQTRWWDYSGRRFHLKGRVCLRNALLFGLMGLALTWYAQPLAEQLIGKMTSETQRVLSSLIIALFVFDLVRTLYTITGLRDSLQKLKALLQELEQYQKEYTFYNKADPAGNLARLRTLSEQADASDELKEMLQRLEALEKNRGRSVRMLNAFPAMQPWNLGAEIDALLEQWRHKRTANKCARQRRRYQWREKIKETYQGITFVQMVWVFIIGSVIGYVVETIFCLAVRGVLESRQGMIYGPFSQIYGFGAVVMVLLLTPLMRRGDSWLFCGGAVIGGVFETVCSVFQELVFHSISWDYSQQTLSLFGGRTSLLYMFFWGILATVYMKFIYPRMAALIDSMARRPKHFFTWAFVVFLSADLLLSVLALDRWSTRSIDIPPQNKVEVWLDVHYPSEMMEDIYPNMRFVHERNTDEGGNAPS